jgi:hypothetical protein
MNVAVYIVAVLVVVTGIYFSQKEKKEEGNEITTYEEVLSESDEESEVVVEEKEIDIITPTNKPSPTKVPVPTQSPQTSNILEYKYPNSQIVSSSSNSLSLESSDNSDSITKWYKDKINSQGMNVKTYVATKANDKILNKLVGADGYKEISIEISKEDSQSMVNISITIISS